MATLDRKISPKPQVHGAIIRLGKDACCSAGCRNDYQGVFRTVDIGDGLPVITQVTELVIEGQTKVLGAAVNITTNAGLKTLIQEIKLFLFQLGFSGDSMEINVYADDLHSIVIRESEAVFESFTTDDTPIEFNLSTDAIVDDCHCNSDEIVLPGTGPGDGDGCLFCGPFPPLDTDLLWRNSTDKMTYFYDGSHWVTQWGEHLSYYREGNVTPNRFIRFVGSITDEVEGPLVAYKVKLYRVSIRNENLTAGDIKIWANGVDKGDFSIAAVNKQILDISYIISEAENVSPQWTGPGTMKDVRMIIFYRKVYMP